MKREEQNTKELLLETGRDEFLERGYEKASLRAICKKAGTTTGVVYFFFENKEDLFGQIVAPFLSRLEKLGQEIVELELKDTSLGIDVDKKLMEFLWHNQTEIQLLWEKSNGTWYANYGMGLIYGKK